MFRRGLALSLAILLAALAVHAEAERPAEIPASPAKAEEREGFECTQWDAESFGNPLQARLLHLPGQEDNRVLCIHYQAGKEDKGALRRQTGMAAAENGVLRAWVYSAEASPPSVAFAVCTGDKFTWQETESVRLKTGWNALAFELKAKLWKSEESEWRNDAALTGCGDVRAIDFLIHSGHDTVVYLDAVKLERDDKASGVEALVAKLNTGTPEDRDAAEKALVAMGHKALERVNDLVDKAPDPETELRARRIQAQLKGMSWNRPDSAPPREKVRILRTDEVGE